MVKVKNPFRYDDEDSPVNKRLLVCGCASVSFGVFLILIGLLTMYVLVDIVVANQAYLNLDLKEGTPQYDSWVGWQSAQQATDRTFRNFRATKFV